MNKSDRSSPNTEIEIGILMLETQFPRILGDIGHPDSWPFPVRYHVVKHASARRAVHLDTAGLVPDFVDAARQLAGEGIGALTTSCGFLSLAQQQLSQAVDVPVACSAMMQVPWINQLLPQGKRSAILTIDADSLSPMHLAAAGVPRGTPVGGVDPKGAFATTILTDGSQWNATQCRQENVSAALELVSEHERIGALVLECTNMVPHADAIHRATGLPVYSINTLIRWLYSGLKPDAY